MLRVPDCDVVVIGAGAAGLSAAGELLASGLRVTLLEGRDRVGGRIWTRREPGLPVPIELGAEFVHGHAPVTEALLQRAGTTVIEAADTHFGLQDGKLRPRDPLFQPIRAAIEASDALEREDMSLDAFLDQHLASVLTPAEREYARMMAQGFDAADTSRASARAIAAEWTGDTVGSGPQSRPREGYASLLAALMAPLSGARLRLQLQTTVHRLRWSRGSIEASGEFAGAPFTVHAARALIAVPLGVLQQPEGTAGAVEFDPPLEPKRTALAGLASGPVIKLQLLFARAFWETLDDGRYRAAGFFHAPEEAFPTFWTPAPASAPLLVAWAGGPRAARLEGAAPADIVRKAIASLKRLFGRALDLEAELRAWYAHDWQQDPFARGAYSYVTVGAQAPRAALAQPIADTLFFAGEATDEEEGGTVAGALRSGQRAAAEILAAACADDPTGRALRRRGNY